MSGEQAPSPSQPPSTGHSGGSEGGVRDAGWGSGGADCRRGGHHGGCGHHHSPGGRGVTVQGEKRAVGYNGRGRGCSAQIPIWPGHIGVKAVQDMTATEGRDIRQSAGGGGHGTDTGALYQT